MILNLLTNAKDAIIGRKIHEGMIRIGVYLEADAVKVEVCDNGGGIEEGALNRLTEPYFTTKEENGTGLGLYMSKTIIEKHFHGKLTYGNKGEGACFYIAFPRSFSEAEE